MIAVDRAALLAEIDRQIGRTLGRVRRAGWGAGGIDDNDLLGEAWVACLEAAPRWSSDHDGAGGYFARVAWLAMLDAIGRWRAHLTVPIRTRLPPLPERAAIEPERAGPDPRPRLDAQIDIARAAARLTPYTRGLALAATGLDGAAWPSVAAIADAHGVTESAVRHARERFAARITAAAA